MNAPLCDCHGIPKYFHSEPRRKAGGYWRCRVRKSECDVAWRKRHPEQLKEINDIYNQKRVKIGHTYYGVVATPELAAEINRRGRSMLNDFKQTQKEGHVACP